MTLIIFSEMLLKAQAFTVKLMKFWQKFLPICKVSLPQEKYRHKNLRTVSRKEDLEQVKIFHQCIQINSHPKILDFSFHHQWSLPHNHNTIRWIRLKVTIWVKCWLTYWNQNQISEEMYLKGQFTSQNGNDYDKVIFMADKLISMSFFKKISKILNFEFRLL